MVDFSDFINLLENIKNGLEEEERKINLQETASKGEKEISALLQNSLEARKQIRDFFLGLASDENQKQKIAEALGSFGNGLDDVQNVQNSFDIFISNFLTQAFNSLVCTEEIHEALHKMTPSQQQDLVEKVEEKWTDLAPLVHGSIFIFDDFKNLDDRAVQKILREIDTQDLGVALHNAKQETKDKFFSNMSRRAASMLQEDMEYMGPVRDEDIKTARNQICSTVMRLESAGEIVLPRY